MQPTKNAMKDLLDAVTMVSTSCADGVKRDFDSVQDFCFLYSVIKMIRRTSLSNLLTIMITIRSLSFIFPSENTVVTCLSLTPIELHYDLYSKLLFNGRFFYI